MLLSKGWRLLQAIQQTVLRKEGLIGCYNNGAWEVHHDLRCVQCLQRYSTLTSVPDGTKDPVMLSTPEESSNEEAKNPLGFQPKQKRVVISPDNSKLLKVAIIGLPNAGKSTLVNSIMSLGVCPVSKRVHTTRTNQRAVLLQNETQVVFIDTPGLVNMKEIKRFSFTKDFVFGPEKSITMADVVAVIHDVSPIISRNKLDPRIRGVLEKFPEKNSILIMNKVDSVKSKGALLDTVRILCGGFVSGRPIKIKKSVAERKRDEEKSLDMENLLSKAKKRLMMKSDPASKEVIEENNNELALTSFYEAEIKEGIHLQGWPKFHDVFMISALHGDGTDLLRDYFITNARPSSWMFNEDVLTDIDPKDLAVKIIKSKLLDHLPQEIPYQLKPMIEYWETKDNGELQIIVLLKCTNERYLGRVLGHGAAVVTRIASESESILVSLLRVPVSLNIKAYTDEKPKEKKSK